MHCPSRDEWLRRLDGEVTANRLVELDAHADRCTTCRCEVATLDDLARALRAPRPGIPADIVTRVMARLDDPPAPARRRWPLLLGGLVAAAAALVIFVAVRDRDSDGSAFQARGIVARDLGRQTGIELYALGGELRPLGEGSRVARDTAYVASYRNLRDDTAYALVFAIDSAREVHWLYPAYSDPTTDPSSIALGSARSPVLFTETVVLDDVAPGPLTLITLISEQALHVSAIEQLPRDARTADVVRARWPGAVVRVTTLDVER